MSSVKHDGKAFVTTSEGKEERKIQPAKKMRATYCDRLRFLDDLENERYGYSNTQGSGNQEVIIIGQTGGGEDNANFDGVVKDDPPEVHDTNIVQADLTEAYTNPRLKNNDVIIGMLKQRGEERVEFARFIEKILEPEIQRDDEIDIFFQGNGCNCQTIYSIRKN
uniref:Uncharacterized protein n=1 Tax=Timema poppense TaxID=170557 RepID=A0A7R9D8B5_TIMPO|nr:unnamed protein product [Timema poppensis]